MIDELSLYSFLSTCGILQLVNAKILSLSLFFTPMVYWIGCIILIML